MGYLYTATAPDSGKSRLAALVIGTGDTIQPTGPRFLLIDLQPKSLSKVQAEFMESILRPLRRVMLARTYFPPGKAPLPGDRILRVLMRRIEVQRQIRQQAALSPGNDEDFAAWSRARDRGDKLTRILLSHLSSKFPIHRSPHQP